VLIVDDAVESFDLLKERVEQVLAAQDRLRHSTGLSRAKRPPDFGPNARAGLTAWRGPRGPRAHGDAGRGFQV
jgi:hypothetical protein